MTAPMTETELEITKLKWRLEFLQGLIVKSYLAVFSSLTEKPPQEIRRRLLQELDTILKQNYEQFLVAVPDGIGALVAEEFAHFVEQTQTLIASTKISPKKSKNSTPVNKKKKT